MSWCCVLVCVIFVFSLIGTGELYSTYRDQIPNGRTVPNPCTDDQTDVWKRVGHTLLNRTKPKISTDLPNNFGLRFKLMKDSNESWVDICGLDSDGDSRTNGQELGDPACIWTLGQTPTITDMALLSHPGIPDFFNQTILQISTNANRTEYCQ